MIAGAGGEVLSVLHVHAGRDMGGGREARADREGPAGREGRADREGPAGREGRAHREGRVGQEGRVAREGCADQEQAWLLARELEGSEGVRQTVATRPDGPLAAAVRAVGVEVRPLSWRFPFDPRAVVGLSRAAVRRDLLHAHSSDALLVAVAALALSGAPCRLVASRRTHLPPRSPWVWRRADVVLAVSPDVAGALVRSGLERRRVRVVQDGIDPDDVHPSGTAAAMAAGTLRAYREVVARDRALREHLRRQERAARRRRARPPGGSGA